MLVGDEFVTLKYLAAELGIDRSNLRKIVRRMGIDLLSVRTAESRNQLTHALTIEDADRVRETRKASGFEVSNSREVLADSGDGVFYAVVLDPEMRPNRIKVGFTNSLESRLSTYRTGNPDLKLLASWPCKRSWEAAALAAVGALDSASLVAGEVYDCQSQLEIVNRCDDLFALLAPITD